MADSSTSSTGSGAPHPGGGLLGAPARGVTFVGEAWGELKKVSFPTRQETMQATIVTLFIMSFVAVCLFVLDWVFNRLMAALFF